MLIGKMAAEHVGRAGLEAKLKELGIETSTIEHEEVFTVEEMMSKVPELREVSGAVTKNLFMKDKKKKLWLLSAVHNRAVRLDALAKQVGAKGGLRLADESVLIEKLGVKQGCVTGFALINDVKGEVNFIVDQDLISDKHEKIYFHPMTNAATTGIAPQDFVKFLEATKHKPISVIFEDEAAGDN